MIKYYESRMTRLRFVSTRYKIQMYIRPDKTQTVPEHCTRKIIIIFVFLSFVCRFHPTRPTLITIIMLL